MKPAPRGMAAPAAPSVHVHDRLDGLAASLLVVLCLAWGLNHVSIKVANEGLQPVFQVGLRAALGALLVFGWCRVRGVRLFARDGTLIAGIVAGLLFGGEFLLIYVALDYTTVSRGIVFLYTMPFAVAIGAHVLVPGERLTPPRVAGLVAAFIGVVIAFSDELSLPGPEALIGDALCVVAAIAWGATTIVIKTTRLRSASPEKVLLYQLVVSAAMQLALAPLYGPLIRELSAVVLVAFAYQVAVVAAVTFLVWFWLIRHYPAAQLSAFTFLTPIFGVAFGGLILAEPLSARLILALALVAAGIFLVNRPRRAAPAAP